MPRNVKVYAGSVITIGALVFLLSSLQWTTPTTAFWAYLGVSSIASLIKLRLPRMTGNYSLNFIFILIGIIYFSLPETLSAAAAAALLQSVCFTKRRPAAIQVLFNMANLVLSGALCWFTAHTLLPSGLRNYEYAVLAAAAAVYFVVNTVLVSGVLHLLEGKPLTELCREWYVWYLPYYLVGAAIVGMLPNGHHLPSTESCLILIPLLYLIHFFYNLSTRQIPGVGANTEEERSLLPVAKLYIAGVITVGIASLAYAFGHLALRDGTRFLGFAAVAVAGSMFKVRLPRMKGTVSAGFVVLLAAIAELSFSEAVILGGIMALVQCLWNPKASVKTVQACFSVAGLVLSTGLAYLLARSEIASSLTVSLPLMLVIATAVLYFTNVLVVSLAVCLVEQRPLETIWQQCCFWSFPYYLVGAAAAGLMTLTSRSAGWLPSMLILPLMALVYVSYDVHVQRATQEVPIS